MPLDNRRSMSAWEDKRRIPGVSRRILVRPCGSDTCAVAAHGRPVRYWKFEANTTPVRGIGSEPITRNAWVRSSDSLPIAFVSVFGSRPNVLPPNVELNCPCPGDEPLEGSRPSVFESVYDASACHPSDQR